MKMNQVPALVVLMLLSACTGNYGDSGKSLAAGGGPIPPTDKKITQKEFFALNIGPNMGYCRSCHIPGASADRDEGRKFMLSTNPLEDYDKVFSSWTLLDKGVTTNRILTKNADHALSHTGGQSWPVGSQSYEAMKTLLTCWDNPTACVLGDTTAPPVALLPLLGSKHARHLWDSFCEGEKLDSTKVLPQDPRSKVKRMTPEYNANKAVYFNAYWQDCHVNLPAKEQQPKTCGDFLTRRDSGRDFLMNKLAVSSETASSYNDTYKKWGLSSRPDNFDEMYTLRYGLNNAPFPDGNPYPTPTDTAEQKAAGGTGKLPLGLRQMKDASGHWNGQIGSSACFQCHGGQIGDPLKGDPTIIKMENLGLGNNNFDVPMAGQDGSPFAGTPMSTLLPGFDVNSLFNIGIKQRGQNNAVGAFEFLITLLDLDSLGLNPNPLKTVVETTGPQDVAHPLAHTQDTPPWWNMGSRPRKFFDAGVSNDSTRIIMAAGPGETSTLVTMDGKAYRDRIELYDQDIEAFLLSLKSPSFPYDYCKGVDGVRADGDAANCINPKLAEQGAILFHTKNLWAESGNATRPKPLGGNGSCASCHGVYAPRYVNDTNYLADPALEGVAAHISPLNVIGTDRARSDMLTPTLRQRWDTTYWGYTEGVPGFVAPESKDPFTEGADDMLPAAQRPKGVCDWEKEIIGYQAPPLYGVWATAPYFHNGSVPTVEAVLDSSKRAPIWQRKLQTSGPATGFDQSLSAYNFSALGWQSTTLTCSQMPGNQISNCNPAGGQGPSLVQLAQNLLNSSLSWAGLVSVPDPQPGSIDKRLIYDTRILGNSNIGHEFSDVLTAQERKSLIEYLKTL